jgi:peptide deformylase
MIYPIRAYGDPVLREGCKEIETIDEEVRKLVSDMY